MLYDISCGNLFRWENNEPRGLYVQERDAEVLGVLSETSRGLNNDVGERLHMESVIADAECPTTVAQEPPDDLDEIEMFDDSLFTRGIFLASPIHFWGRFMERPVIEMPVMHATRPLSSFALLVHALVRKRYSLLGEEYVALNKAKAREKKKQRQRQLKQRKCSNVHARPSPNNRAQTKVRVRSKRDTHTSHGRRRTSACS